MTCCIESSSRYITYEPSNDFPIDYGKSNTITFTFEDIDLTGQVIEFRAYKGSIKYLDITQGDNLSFTVQPAIAPEPKKTIVSLTLDEADSALIPVAFKSRAYLDYSQCDGLVPSCDYEMDSLVAGNRYTLLSGIIQNTPTGRAAV
jgi:hypothetical protein